MVLKSAEDTELIAKAEAAGILTYLNASDLGTEMTRLELAMLLAGLGDLQPIPGVTVSIADCGDLTDQEKQLLAVVLTRGWITTHEDGNFYPQQTLSRAEVAAILYKYVSGDVKGKDVSRYADGDFFTDVSSSAWYAGYVNYGATEGYLTGTEFRPTDTTLLRDALQWMLAISGDSGENDGGNTNPAVPNDINGDGIVNVYDAIDLLSFIANQ